MDYSMDSPTEKDIICLFSGLLILITMYYLDLFLNEEFLRQLFGTIFAGSIALFAVLVFIVTEKTKSLIEFFKNLTYLNLIPKPNKKEDEPEAYEEWCYIMIYGAEIFTRFFSYEHLKKKLNPGMSPNEKLRHELSYKRIVEISRIFRKFVCWIGFLLFLSMLSIFIAPVLVDLLKKPDFWAGWLIFFILLISAILILVLVSLWNAFKIVRKLFFGGRKERKKIEEGFPEIFNRQ